MEGIEEFIRNIRLVKLEDYTIDDASRISLILWESMLDYLDHMDVSIVPTHETVVTHTMTIVDGIIDLVTCYHSTVHYPVSCNLESLRKLDGDEKYQELRAKINSRFPYQRPVPVIDRSNRGFLVDYPEDDDRPVVLHAVVEQQEKGDSVLQTLLENRNPWRL